MRIAIVGAAGEVGRSVDSAVLSGGFDVTTDLHKPVRIEKFSAAEVRR